MLNVLLLWILSYLANNSLFLRIMSGSKQDKAMRSVTSPIQSLSCASCRANHFQIDAGSRVSFSSHSIKWSTSEQDMKHL